MTRTNDISRLAFQYPRLIHVRRHGPLGYVNYQSYKPWLRDEFQFRCVYCLWRETWVATGEEAFSVEHLTPRTSALELECDYESLVYACSRCNSIKSDARFVLDPCRQLYGEHLEVLPDGAIRGLTDQGQKLIEVCRVDESRISQARRQLLELLRIFEKSTNSRAKVLLSQYLGYPENLPALNEYRPPCGNSRPEGIVDSYLERKRRGDLLEIF